MTQLKRGSCNWNGELRARELDTGPASLYVYFRNTSELYGAILDELLETVDLTPVDPSLGPAEQSGDWRAQLTQVLMSYLMVLFEYPSLARAALVTRPSGPRYMGLFERLPALLSEGGIPPARAAWAADLLLQFATTSAAELNGILPAPRPKLEAAQNN